MKFVWKLFILATFLGFSVLLYQQIYKDYKAEVAKILKLKKDSEDFEKLYANFYEMESMFDSLMTSFITNRQSLNNHHLKVENMNNKKN